MRALVVSIVLAGSARAHAQPASASAPVSPDGEGARGVPVDGETIVVEGERERDVPSAGVRVVTARALELTPHRNADELLRVVPGLYTSQHGSEGKGQQFFLRGFDAVHGADLAIRVGGLPINELSNVHGQGYADVGFVIPETVAGLVARKGPFDLEQGWFATAGSIELELGLAERRGARVGYELGSTNRHRLVAIAAPVDGPAAELVAVDVMHDDGFGDNRGNEKVALLAQTELRAGRLRLRPLIIAHAARFGEPGVIPLDELARGTFTRDSAPAGALDGSSRRILTGLTAAWRRGADDVSARAYLGWRGLRLDENFTGFLASPEHGDARRQVHRAATVGGRIAWRHRAAPWLHVLAGAELARDELVQAEDRVSISGPRGEGRTTTPGTIWGHERALAAAQVSTSAWLGGEVRRGAWIATAGVRADGVFVDARDRLAPERSGEGRAGALSPRTVLAWRPAWGAIALAGGRGVRPPEARAFTARPSRENEDASVYDGGDPEVTQADAVELGGERRWERGAVGVTAFATWIDREAIFDHVSGVNALGDGSRRYGAEAFVEATPRRWLALRGDVTFVDARFVVTGNPVPGAPRWLATTEARVDRAPWSAGLAGRFLGARPLAHGARAAGSIVLDAVVGWTHGRWTLELQLDNVTGTDWNEGEYHFASRWDLALPASELPRVHISPGRPFGARIGATLRL